MLKAVITGDIVHSTKMLNEHKSLLYKSLLNFLNQIGKQYKMKSEMFRGDSFQCLLEDPEDALRVALLIKTYIRSLNPIEKYGFSKAGSSKQKNYLVTKFIFDARITIGIGEVENRKSNLSASDGTAFLLSGHLLDKIKNTKQYFSIATNDKYHNELQTESILLDTIISKTTALQCEVINWKLFGFTEMEIAKKVNIMQSAVNQRSNSGSWHAIDAMIERFETIYTNGK